MQRLFADRVEFREPSRREYAEVVDSLAEYVELCKATFGPIVAVYDELAGSADLQAAADRDFLAFAHRCNTGPSRGPAEYRDQYLRVIATRRRAAAQ